MSPQTRRPYPHAADQSPVIGHCKRLRMKYFRLLVYTSFAARTHSRSANQTPITIALSGVDIDAGMRFRRYHQTIVRSTARRGADAALSGFGGLFDLKAAGFDDPLLVAATDGVGTKLKLAFATGIHDTVGIDLVAMCVNDLVVQGAEPFSSRLPCDRPSRCDVAAAVVSGVADGCRQPAARLSAARPPRCPACTVKVSSISRLCGWCGRTQSDD